MPLEGHWERQNTPLRQLGPRERRLLGFGGVLLALATVVVVALALAAPTPSTRAGCIDVTEAGTMGAVMYRACGDDARHRCDGASRIDAPLLRACEQARFATRLRAPS